MEKGKENDERFFFSSFSSNNESLRKCIFYGNVSFYHLSFKLYGYEMYP